MTDLDKIRELAQTWAREADYQRKAFGEAAAFGATSKEQAGEELLALLDSLPAPPACPDCEAPADHCVECGTPYPPWLVNAALRAS